MGCVDPPASSSCFSSSDLECSKPKGIRAARTLKNHRQEQRWNDKQYNRAHLGTALKANPMGGTSHAKGIVLEKLCALPPVSFSALFLLEILSFVSFSCSSDPCPQRC